jgi:heme oxygenase
MANKKVYTIEGQLDTRQIIDGFRNMAKSLRGAVDTKALEKLAKEFDKLELAANDYNRIMSEGIVDTAGLKKAQKEVENFYTKVQTVLGRVKQTAGDSTLAILSDEQLQYFKRRKSKLKTQITELNKIIQDSNLRFTKAFSGIEFKNGQTKIDFQLDTEISQELSKALSTGNLADFNKQVDKLGENVSQTLAKKLTAGFSDGMKRNVKTLESLGARVATQVQNINKIWNSEKNVADYLTGSDKGKAINLLGVNKQRTISNRTAQIEAIDQAGVISSEKYKDNLEEIARLESEITKEEQKAAEVREKANIINQKRLEIENEIAEIKKNNNIEGLEKQAAGEATVPDRFRKYLTATEVRENDISSPLAALRDMSKSGILSENVIKKLNNIGALSGADTKGNFLKIWEKVSKDNKVISELPNELRRVFNDAYNLLKTNKATGADGKPIDYSRMYQYVVAKSQVDKQAEASSKLDVIYDRINKLSDQANALKQESKSVLPGKAEEESRKNITNYRKQISDLNKENTQFLNRENLQQELNELERLTDQANINKLEQIKNILSEMGIDTADIQTIEQATEAVKELQAAVSGAQQNRQAIMEQVRTAGQTALGNQNSYSMDSYAEQRDEAQRQLQNIEQEQTEATNQRVSQSLESISEAQNDVAQSTENATNAQKRSASVIGDSLERQQQLNSSLEDFKDRIKYFISFQNVLYGVKNAVLQTYNDVVELDEALASIAMVSDYSVEDMWGFYDQYADMAQKMGQNTKDVIQSSALYVQQGILYVHKGQIVKVNPA